MTSERNIYMSGLALTAALVAGGCHMTSPDRPAQTAFGDESPRSYCETDALGRSVAVRLTRPRFSGVEIAHLAHAVAGVIVEDPLPPVDSIPAGQLQSFEEAAAAVEGRVWLALDAGGEDLEFNYYPDKPAVMGGVIDRASPSFDGLLAGNRARNINRPETNQAPLGASSYGRAQITNPTGAARRRSRSEAKALRRSHRRPRGS